MEIERPPTSTLIKRLREASRVKPRSMGFGRREDEAAAPAMVLIAEVAGLDARAARAAAASGAAAVAFAVTGSETAALAAGDDAALQEAVLAGRARPGSGSAGLTVFDLMAYKLVVESVRQPVLVVADDAIRPDDLQALRDVGVDGLILAASHGAEATLAPYRDAIARVKI